MKKIALFVFIGAIVIGSIVSNYFNFGSFGLNRAFSSVSGSGVRKTETRNVKDFDKINVGGAINIKVSAGEDFAVQVESDDNILQFVKTEVENGTLKIYIDGSFKLQNSVDVKISMPQISGLLISGASKAVLENVNTGELAVNSSGASKTEISGKSAKLNLDASGASVINAVNTESEDVYVNASGASKVSVSAKERLKADASGASRVNYEGNPINVEKTVSGASSVVQR